MNYLKGTIIDNFQTERIAFRLIDYNKNEDVTIVENVLIFAKKYTRYIVDRRKGDCTLKIIKSELNDCGFSESNEEEYKRDISGKMILKTNYKSNFNNNPKFKIYDK